MLLLSVPLASVGLPFTLGYVLWWSEEGAQVQFHILAVTAPVPELQNLFPGGWPSELP